MTTNERFRALMEERGLDTRPDPRTNQDAKFVAGLLGVTTTSIINWLSPAKWKKHRPMPSGYLELAEIKLKKTIDNIVQ